MLNILLSLVVLPTLLIANMAVQTPAPNSSAVANPQVLQNQAIASQQAAEKWLMLADQGNYAGSWNAAAIAMKAIMRQHEWVKVLEAVRKPLGAVKERKLSDIKVAKDPKGLPAGDYMVIVYETSFSGTPRAFELLTLQDSSTGWHVMSYFISVK